MIFIFMPIPVTAGSKTWQQLACWDYGIESCREHKSLSLLIVLCFQVCQADLSSRGVLPNVVRLGVIVTPGYCGGLEPLGFDAPWRKIIYFYYKQLV